MPEIMPGDKIDPKDQKIANLYMSWLIKTQSDDILEELEQLTDVALTGETDFGLIVMMLLQIDHLVLTVPGTPHMPLAPLFIPLQLRYAQLLQRMRAIAAAELSHAQHYVAVVLPSLKDADYSNDEKKEVVQEFITFLAKVKSQSDQLQEDFETLRRQLDDFAKLLEKFALGVGIELTKKIREVQDEIDRLMREIAKFQRQAQDDQPSLENTSKSLLFFGASAAALSGSKAVYTTAAVAAEKTTLATGASAAGSAGCVAALNAALPVAMVVLAGWGVWAAVKSAQVIADLARISELSAELILRQIRLAELLRQTVTLGTVQVLARNTISSVAVASIKVGNLVRVWSMVSQDAQAMLDLLDAGATTEEIVDNALVAESWYRLLITLLQRLSSKLLPRVDPPQVGQEASKQRARASLQRLLEYFACQGGTSHFLPQSRPMPPLSSPISGHDLPLNVFVREFDSFFDGSTFLDEGDLSQDQRAMMETLTGMRHPQPFLFDAGSGTALGDVGVATLGLNLGRIGSRMAHFAKSGVLRTGVGHARRISSFFGPRVTSLTGNREFRRELFRNFLMAALDVDSLPTKPEDKSSAHQTVMWLILWRLSIMRWLVIAVLWKPWEVFFDSELWSNIALFQNLESFIGGQLKDMHEAFEKWHLEHPKDGREDHGKGPGGDDDGPPHTTAMFVSQPEQLKVLTADEPFFSITGEAGTLDDDVVGKLAEKTDALSVDPSTTDAWQGPFQSELSKWDSQKFASIINNWLAGGDESHFWQDFGRAVYEDKFEVIDQIYRFNILQLSILTADLKLSMDGELFNKLVERMLETYANARSSGHNEATALSAMYFYAARCPTFGRLVLALALQNALVKIFNS